MAEQTVPAMRAPSPERDNPLTRSLAGVIGMVILGVLVLACVGTLPWTLGENADGAVRYNAQNLNANLLPPSWAPHSEEERAKAEALGNPLYLFGTDRFGRDVFVRCLAGGGISIGIGLAAAFIAVGIGTLYGSLAGYIGGRVDSAMMRFVDILYGLPYILLVVLLAVAGDAVIDEATLKKTARADWITERAYAALEEQGVEDPHKDDAREYLDAHPDFRVQLDEQLTMGPYLSRAARPDGEGETVSHTKAELYDLWVEERAPALASLPGYDLDLASEADLKRAFGSLRSLQPTPLSEGQRTTLEVVVLLVAIGGVSWLTMARVIRGQVLSLKERRCAGCARHHAALCRLFCGQECCRPFSD